MALTLRRIDLLDCYSKVCSSNEQVHLRIELEIIVAQCSGNNSVNISVPYNLLINVKKALVRNGFGVEDARCIGFKQEIRITW